MATVERSRSRKKNPPDDADVKSGKSHAFRNGCLAMLLLLSVAVFFAPGIIAHLASTACSSRR